MWASRKKKGVYLKHAEISRELRRVGWSTFTASPPLLARLRAEITSVPTQANRKTKKTPKDTGLLYTRVGKKRGGEEEEAGKGRSGEKRETPADSGLVTSRNGFIRCVPRFIGHSPWLVHVLSASASAPTTEYAWSRQDNPPGMERLCTTGITSPQLQSTSGARSHQFYRGLEISVDFFLIFPEKLAMKLSDTNRSKIWPPVAQGGKAER